MNMLKSLYIIIVIAAVSPALGQIGLTKEAYQKGVELLKAVPNPKVSAVDLYAEYQKNGVAWEDKYAENWRYLTGVVQSVGRDILDQRVLELRANKPMKNVDYWETIQVMYPEKLPNNVKRDLASYKVGQTVEVLVQFRNDPSVSDALYFDENEGK
jgi:hypothetical protein